MKPLPIIGAFIVALGCYASYTLGAREAEILKKERDYARAERDAILTNHVPALLLSAGTAGWYFNGRGGSLVQLTNEFNSATANALK